MTRAASYVPTVQAIYEAFGRGDVPTILGHLAEDVEWEYGGGPVAAPWLEPRRGRESVVGFFQALGGGVEIEHFAVTALLEATDLVVALVDITFTVRATGRRVEEHDEVHLWRFRDGQVARFRHRSDTLQHFRAAGG